jgi:hypothetical protein
LPGKPEAPARFRKAAASILQGQKQLQEKLDAVFLCSKAPPFLRKKIKKGLNTIQAWPERFNDAAVPRDLEEVTKDFTGRLLAFHGRDPKVSKLQSIVYANLGTIAKRINQTIDVANKYWKSAKPMAASKAVLLDQIYRTRKVDSQYLTLLLARRGVYDTAVRDLISGMERTIFLPDLPKEAPGMQDAVHTKDETSDLMRSRHFITAALLKINPDEVTESEDRANYTWRSDLQGREKDLLKHWLTYVGKAYARALYERERSSRTNWGPIISRWWAVFVSSFSDRI